MRTKEERKRCKKEHETTIGKIIYGFLLFLPLLAIGVTCGYAMFNKNAKDSYYGATINDKQYVATSSISNLEVSKSYVIFNETYLNYESTGRLDLYISNIVNNSTEYRDISQTNHIALYSNVYNNTNHIYIVFYNGDTQITNYDFLTTRVNISFDLETFSYRDNVDYYLPLIYRVDYEKVSFVSEVFYYSVDRVTQSNLFNWSQNSIIYTGMSNFTTALSITNTFIPTLLTYWLIISIIYFMYDIVLMMLTILHKKIHDLQDSL